MSVLNIEIDEGIARLTLDRPKAFNSINAELAKALQDALDYCSNNDEIRVVVITGMGKAFCAGQDLVEVTSPERMPGFRTLLEKHYQPIILRLRQINKPVVAVVNGVAAGAGANIALACDIVIASDQAMFIQAFSSIGLIPDSGGTYFLPRLIGFQKALAIAMLADKISAEEAAKLGMIYKVIKQEELDDYVNRLAHKVAQMPTKALALTKQAFNQSLHNSLEAQLKVENEAQIKASETEDYKEGVQAFLEKRTPIFKGN